MNKVFLAFVLVFAVSSTAFAVSDKVGIGVGYNIMSLGEIVSVCLPAQDISVRGIFSNFAAEISGSYNYMGMDDQHYAVSSDLALSLTYLFDFRKDLALEAGIIGTSASFSADEGAIHIGGIGLLLGAECFISENFGVGIRVVPLMSVSGTVTGGVYEWGNVLLGYASVSAHLYL